MRVRGFCGERIQGGRGVRVDGLHALQRSTQSTCTQVIRSRVKVGDPCVYQMWCDMFQDIEPLTAETAHQSTLGLSFSDPKLASKSLVRSSLRARLVCYWIEVVD